MSSKSQSPGPNAAATTSQPKQARSRKAAVSAEQITAGRAGSAGGIVLDKEQSAKKVTSSASSSATKATPQTAPSAKDSKDAGDAPTTPTSAGPNRQRRRPRKLNRDAPTDDAPSATITVPAATTPTTELEALKSRVRGLEAKVEELYKSSDGRNRSPRRRGKGRKSSSAQSVPTLTNAAAEPEEEEADEELVRAEEELESARRDLEIYQPRARPRGKRSVSGETEYIEEIPRGQEEEYMDSEGRQVTLTGSYRIPLPSTLNMKDVKTIQSGVSAAQSVARSFLEQRRATREASTSSPAPSSRSTSTRATPNPTPGKEKNVATKPSRKTSNMEVKKETDGKSWGEWFGGYSMAISRAVKSIEAEAAIESQRAQTRSSQGAASASGAKKSGGSGKRPARGRQSEGVA